MYNNQLLYTVVIWAFFGIRLWTEKVALTYWEETPSQYIKYNKRHNILILMFMTSRHVY